MNTANHFDSHARTWDDDPAKVARANAIADAIRQQLPLSRTQRALEYGCGTGLLGFALRTDLGDITLADSSPGMLAELDRKIAAAKAANMRSLKLDLVTDPLPAARFDLIFTLMTLHHIEDTDRILRDFHALLEPAGALCIADLDAEDGSFHGPDFTGHKGFDRIDLHEKVLQAGFSSVAFSTAFEISKAEDRRYPVFLMVAKK